MNELKLFRILPFLTHGGIELYLNDTRLNDEDYLKVMNDSYCYKVVKIIPYNDDKLELHIAKIEKEEN